MNRCYSCFKEYDAEYDLCPFCGEVHSDEPIEPIHLKPGTILGGQYVVGYAIGSGGFGIIYKAWDLKLEVVVAVKEFFASKFMTRAAGDKNVIVNKKSKDEYRYRKARFLAEARNMAKFGSHRNIPNVFEFFEENETAYIVMELLEGQALNEYLRQVNGKVDQELAIFVANEVGNALIAMHDHGIIHRDVAPDNIFICSEKELRVRLLDLGGAKLADDTDKVIDIILKPGYSPIEQYDNTKSIGPWTDVYALGATLYYMLTGIKPDESTNRKINDVVKPPHEIDSDIPEYLSNAIMKAMAIEKHLRFKTVAEFLKAINGEKKVVSLAKEKKLRKRRKLSGILAACLAILITFGVVFYSYSSKKNEQILADATISVWFSVADGSNEEKAIQSIVEDFKSKFPNVDIVVRAIPEENYVSEIEHAAANGTLPSLFESTDVSDATLTNALDISNVLNSEQAKSCLFLSQYQRYYSDKKRIPLAIEIPMAYVITNGHTSVSYSDVYFGSIDAFGGNAPIAADSRYVGLLDKNFNVTGLSSETTFLNNEENTSAVLLSSSMALNEVRETLTSYEKTYVFYNSSKIHCDFIYEWSLGGGNENERHAAERLLSWMLGNAYQNTLMISMCSDGQIPVNETCFNEKTDQQNYKPLKNICMNFWFER